VREAAWRPPAPSKEDLMAEKKPEPTLLRNDFAKNEFMQSHLRRYRQIAPNVFVLRKNRPAA
jgi:hypothetical protein